jgi:hypothetical protein
VLPSCHLGYQTVCKSHTVWYVKPRGTCAAARRGGPCLSTPL